MREASDNAAWLIPPEALGAWLRLAAAVDEIRPAPCQTSDAEAWWPARNELDEFAAQMAVDACSVCGARDSCLAFALAADEREGIWARTLPSERKTLRRPTAA